MLLSRVVARIAHNLRRFHRARSIRHALNYKGAGPKEEAATLRKTSRASLVYERNANLLFNAEAGSFDPLGNPCFGQRERSGELDGRRTALVLGIQAERQIITGKQF